MTVLARRVERRAIPALSWVVIGAAWLIAGLAELTGGNAMLHHHALIDGGPPLSVSLLLFGAGWLVMVAAMMLPASVDVIAAHTAATAHRATGAVSGFVGAFFLAWLVVGFAFFVGDMVVHWLVETTPWIADRSWLIEAGVVAFAGIYQFAPLKRRFLDACRHPIIAARGERSGLPAGVAHAVDCVGSSGPMMLLMFAAGLANIWWMLGLTVVMVYEARGSHGQRAASIAGAVLIALALLALTHSGLPAWAAP